MKKTLLLLLLGGALSIGNFAMAGTQTIMSGTVSSGAFTYSSLTDYSYSQPDSWPTVNSGKIINIAKSGNFSFTNKLGVIITGITVKGVAQNNKDKESEITISDGVNSVTTGEATWKNRQSADPTEVTISSGISSLNMAAGTSYTVSNSDGYALGIQIVITYTTVSVSTLSGRNYGTMVTPSDKKLNFAGANGIQAYIATGIKGDKTAILLSEVSVAPVNTPIIVYTETAGSTIDVPATAADASAVTSSQLVAGDGSTAWDGTPGYTYYYLASDQFHKATSGTLQLGKAYLKVLTSEVPATAPSLFFEIDEEHNATDIQSIESADKAIKFFEDGKLLIMRDGIVYDALGRIIR